MDINIEGLLKLKPISTIAKNNKDKNKENLQLILMKYGMSDKKKVK